ncbi:MAG: ATP-binding protein [Brevundimonas sp.]|uniref:ATP-binding protein n=1 Tax=Brevundimonas sp. TaxID=1871086 RepID=UPI00391BDF4D
MPASDFRLLARAAPPVLGDEMPDRFRLTLAGMRTEPWLLYGAWAVGGLVLALLGYWQVGLVASLCGAAVDAVFQRRLKRLSADPGLTAAAGIARLTPIVATRFTLGVAGALVVVSTDHAPSTIAAILMLQAWSICVALAQFCAVPRLFFIAIAPPLATVVVAIWPYLLGVDGPALGLSLGLLILMLVVIGRQVGRVWAAWQASWSANGALIGDLRSATVAAEAASRAKSVFLATMSHEVRTPLNGILGMAQVMDLHPLDEAQRARLKVIRRSGESLLTTLNAVLDLSQIEAGRLDLSAGRVEPEALVRETAAAFGASARLKGVGLVARCDRSAAGVFEGDPARLGQILGNLVGNAIKFTDAGEVRLTATADAEHLRFSVEDSGRGIAPEDLDLIFSPFEQGRAAGPAHPGGSGLGLSISRQLAELMGGRLTAESRLGHGSVFTLVLPARQSAPPQPAAEDAAPPPPAGGFSVLVAEDNPTNQLVIAGLLQSLGAEVEMAADGRAVLQALNRRLFDVILMDVQMPEMNGLEATRAIRRGEAGPAAARLPVIGVTGNAMRHQVEECLDAGMTAVVPKPIALPLLVEVLNTHLAEIGQDG